MGPVGDAGPKEVMGVGAFGGSLFGVGDRCGEGGRSGAYFLAFGESKAWNRLAPL